MLLGATGCFSLAPHETILPQGGVTIEASVPDGRPLVEVMLNGQGPFTFMVDTGVAPVLIRAALVERLGLPSEPNHSWVGVAPDGRVTEPQPMVRVDTLDVGGARFRGVVAGAALDDRCDGILGMALFSECTLSIDLHGPSLHLGREPLDPVDPWTVRCDLADGTPRIPATVRSGDAVFECWPTLDTGAAAMFAFPMALAKTFVFRGSVLARTTTALGSSDHLHGTVEGTLTIGPGLVVAEWQATLLDGPGLIGVQFLRDYVVSVDARSALVRLAPRTEP